MRSSSILDELAARRRLLERQKRPRPPKPPYSPRIRRDQVRALYYLKRFEGRAMTNLLHEALDRYLAAHGGAEALVARGIAGVRRPRRRALLTPRRATSTNDRGRCGHPAAPPLLTVPPQTQLPPTGSTDPRHCCFGPDEIERRGYPRPGSADDLGR